MSLRSASGEVSILLEMLNRPAGEMSEDTARALNFLWPSVCGWASATSHRYIVDQLADLTTALESAALSAQKVKP